MEYHEENQKNNEEEIIKKYDFLQNLTFIPPLPPKTLGLVEKMGKLLFNYKTRFIEVDPSLGIFRRFKNKNNYPNNPIEIIPLINIVSCKRINSWFTSDDYYYFELIYTQSQVYRFKSEKVCEKWIETLNLASIYTKFWKSLEKKEPRVVNYIQELKTKTIEIDNETGELKKYYPNSKISQKYKSLNGITFNSFELLENLGSGTFGTVFKVRLKSNGNIYAMKIINKNFLIRNKQLRYAVSECNILKQISSNFITILHFSFQTPENLYMILDYCPGGDLNYHIIQNLFNEQDAKYYIAELILGIEQIHKKDIIYRDLKPENILIDENNHIKLADFGLAKEGITDEEVTKSFCGSPAYLSPEMLKKVGVGKSADIYGIGAVLYEMITGSPPFYANDMGVMYKNIAKNKLVLKNSFSNEISDLFTNILNKDPRKRFGIKEIKEHIFFKDINWDEMELRKCKMPLDLVKIKINLDKRNNNYNNKKDNYLNDVDYDDSNRDFNRVIDFTFIREEENEV
jgi:serum/glucocorticoid-regulated kinase 2